MLNPVMFVHLKKAQEQVDFRRVSDYYVNNVWWIDEFPISTEQAIIKFININIKFKPL